jgi:AraC-like DNA-binding protein
MSARDPLPPLAEPAMVAPVFLVPILSAAVARKVPLNALLRGLEMDAADFDVSGTVISRTDAITVVRRAMQHMPIGGDGLALGQLATVTERGVLALGLLAASTLGDAISLAVRFAASAGYLLQVRELRTPHGRQLLAEPFPGEHDVQRFLVDLTFSAAVQVRRQITGARYAPEKVEFMCEAPAHGQAYEAYFGCPVHFGCLSNALSTHDDWLGKRLPWANAMASHLSLQWLEREAERFNVMPALGFSVARAIRRQLPKVADLAEVARSLNLSERTLRRQLATTGLSFRQLLDEGRKARALDLMATGNRPISELAAATGFSDARAFSRAFRRWTGGPPSQVRACVADIRPGPLSDPA